MKDMIDCEVAEGLARLRQLYPTEFVALKVQYPPGKPVQYTAQVCGPDGYSEGEYGWGPSAHEAIESLKSRAGERSPQAKLQAKAGKLKDELESVRKQLQAIGAIPMGDNEDGTREGLGHCQEVEP